MKNLSVLVLIILLPLLRSYSSWCQVNPHYYGGIAINPDDQIKMERALFTVEYKYYPTEDGCEGVDTLTLAVGVTQSVFLDAGFKAMLLDWKKKNSSVINKGYQLKFRVKEDEVIMSERDAVCLGKVDHGNPVQLYKDRKDSVATAYLIYDIASEGRRYYKTTMSLREMWDWEIGNDTDMVMNYVCSRAHSNGYTCWFTMAIPVGDGPGVFCGLPGLVLRVEKEGKGVVYEAMSIQNEPDAFIVKDDVSYDETGREQFDKAVHKARNTRLGTWMGEHTIYWTHDNK